MQPIGMMEEGRGAPYGILLVVVVVVVVALVVVVPTLLGEEALTDLFAELLSPTGLLLPILLLLIIQFLSSDSGSFVASIFSTGGPESIHRASGSPMGVALFLVLVLFLLFNRISIFGGDGDDE